VLMQKAAIVILNYNGEKMLRQFLPDVIQHSVYDVIVADNASSDGSLDFLNTDFPKLETVRLEANHGFAQGYNLALEQLQGRYQYYRSEERRVGKGCKTRSWPGTS